MLSSSPPKITDLAIPGASPRPTGPGSTRKTAKHERVGDTRAQLPGSCPRVTVTELVLPCGSTTVTGTACPGLTPAAPRTARRWTAPCVVHRGDHIAGLDPGGRCWPARYDAANRDTGGLTVLVDDGHRADTERGSPGVGDMAAVGDELSGDVGNHVAGDREPDAWCCGTAGLRGDRGHVGTPITLADRSTSAPPLLPGLIAALVWMAWGRVAPGEPSPAGSVTARPTAETMPSVTLPVSPSGLPMASTMSPICNFEESPKRAGFSPVGGWSRWITARSSGG